MSKLDPRTKLVIIICISTAALTVHSIVMLTGLLIFTICLMLAGGVRWKDQKRQLTGALGTVLFLFVLQTLFGNILLAFEVSARLLIIIMSAMILLTGQPRDYLLALTQMKVPYELAYMVILAFHFFPILKEEALDVYYSIQLRGTEVQKCSIGKKLKAYRKMCIPVIAGAIERAKDTAIAMEARAFRAYHIRTYMRKLKLEAVDYIVMIIFAILTALFIYFASQLQGVII